jgi:nucleotide-binding universal stress UspA family protein
MSPVLAAVSLSPRSAIVQSRAAALAGAAGVPLHLLHVLRPLAGEKAKRSALARLQLAAARLRDELGQPVEVSIASGSVAGAVIARAEALRPRAIVMGAGRRAGRIQQRLDVPLVAVRGRVQGPYRRVLLAAELSPHDQRTLAQVRREFAQAHVRVVHVFQWDVVRPLRFWLLADELASLYRRRALAEAAAAVRRFADRNEVADVTLEARHPDVAAALRLQASDFGAELVVLSPERSWMKAALRAGVTRRLVEDPPCDLLLAPRLAQGSGTGIRREVGERLAAP